MKLLKKKTILIFGGIVILLFVLLIGVVLSSWESIVKKAVTGELSKITSTNVSIGKLAFSPFSGSLAIHDFVIGNPKEYKTKSAFEFSTLAVNVDIKSFFSDKVIIKQISVKDVAVTYETALTTSNLSQIKENIDNYTKKLSKEKQPAGETKEKSGEKGKKFIIDQLDVTNAKLLVAATISSQAITLKLADVHMSDIGRQSNGITSAELAVIIYDTLYSNIMNLLESSNLLTRKGKQVLDEVKNKAHGVIDGVKKLFK